MENKVIKVIKNRVSCRAYSDRKVSTAKAIQIAQAGEMAPSGMNRQIANILVVQSKKYVEKLRTLSLEIRGKDCYYGAKTFLIVHGPRDDRFTYQDCSCVLENMFIAAASLNINSCWINQTDELLSSPKGLKLKKALGIPEENMVVGTCILGYAAEGTKLEVKQRKEDFIRIL